MIRIKKSNNPPIILIEKGRQEKSANNALYDSNPTAYDNGIKVMEIDPEIYGHKTVRSQLSEEQYGKCCYCESDFEAVSSGDVEHFRPKGGYRNGKGDRIIKPGYYWKAYDYDNLFYSCINCNRSYKRNYFPIEDESKRAQNHNDDSKIELEKPLLINPSQDNPEEHIGFNRESCVHKSQRGKISIEVYGLNRPMLVERRKKYLNMLQCFLDLLEISKISRLSDEFLKSAKSRKKQIETIKNAIQLLTESRKNCSPYTSMINHNFPELQKILPPENEHLHKNWD